MLTITGNEIQNLEQFASSGIDQSQLVQKYPAIQLDQYLNLTPKSKPRWCFSESSMNLIPTEWWGDLKVEIEEIFFSGDTPQNMYFPKVELRFVPLFIPKSFIADSTGKVFKKGQTEWGEGCKSICKLFMLPIVDGKLLSTVDAPFIVTLKVKGERVAELVGSAKHTTGTLGSLSGELAKAKVGTPGKSNIHFSNLVITPGTGMYKSAKTGKETRAANYKLSDARLNSPEVMAIVSQIIANPELQMDILDPFGLDIPQPQSALPPVPVTIGDEDICF